MMPSSFQTSSLASSAPSTSSSVSFAPSTSITALRRGSAPPPAPLPPPNTNGTSSRKNSSPEVNTTHSGSSSGPLSALSILGIGKRSPKNNTASSTVSSSGSQVSGRDMLLSREYPVFKMGQHPPPATGESSTGTFSSVLDGPGLSPLKAMNEVDEDQVLEEDLQDDLDQYPAPSACVPSQNLSGATASSDGGGINISLDTLREMLKCVGCGRFLFPPILQCVSGHMECRNCFEIKSHCARCRGKMIEVPAKFAEMITEQFRIQCSYADKGCQETIAFKNRRDHEEVCSYKPVQCPEFDCSVRKPLNEIFKHFRLEHQHHFVNAHGNIFNGDIRCDDANMVMGVERKWAPTMMKLEGPGDDSGDKHDSSMVHHFFLEIVRSKHGLWHMWIWYLGEPEEAHNFRCEIAIRKKNRDEETEMKYSGRVHSIRIPPHRIIMSGCLLSFTDHAATHFRYLGDGHSGHPVIDYKVAVTRVKSKKRSSSNERAMAAGLTKMLRRFSIDSGQNKANKTSNIGPYVDSDNDY